jgi:hypothetical protein
LTSRRNLVVAVLLALSSAVLMAQDSAQAVPEQSAAQRSAILKEFTRAAKMDGVTLSFVLLNNKTVDVLFTGEGRYSIRARANGATTFYVQGVPQKDITFDPHFVVEQDGKTFDGVAINISNLKAGDVAKGDQIRGLIQLSQKIDISKPFKIKGVQNVSADFNLTREAIRHLEN